MREIIYFLGALGVAVICGLFLAHVPAFVLVEVGHFSIAVPIWLLVIFVLVLSVVWMILRQVIRRILIVPQALHQQLDIMRQRQKVRKKIEAIEVGIKRASRAVAP